MKGTATEITICGKRIKLGDEVVVNYESGGSIKGEVIEIWSPTEDGHFQARVKSGWCFHDHDEIVQHHRAVR